MSQTNTWAKPSDYFSGQGVALIASRNAAGTISGFRPLGNCTDLKLTNSTSTVNHKEASSGNRALDKRLTTEISTTFSMTLEDWSKENLALVSRGTVSDIPAGNATGKVAFHPGLIVSLGYLQVSELVIDNASTPLTEGTDYKVNYDAGSIQWANAITGLKDGDLLDATFKYGAQTNVDALSTGAAEYALRFEGLNTADENTPVVVEVFRVASDPFKELALISDTIGQFVCEGSVLQDLTQTTGSKFYRVKKLAPAA